VVVAPGRLCSPILIGPPGATSGRDTGRATRAECAAREPNLSSAVLTWVHYWPAPGTLTRLWNLALSRETCLPWHLELAFKVHFERTCALYGLVRPCTTQAALCFSVLPRVDILFISRNALHFTLSIGHRLLNWQKHIVSQAPRERKRA